jgi:acetate kinase
MTRSAALVLNAGSSSLKFAVFDLARDGVELVRGEIEGIGVAPHFRAFDSARQMIGEWRRPAALAPHEALLDELLDWIETHLGDAALVAVGHRVVHGGARFAAPALVSPEVLAALEALVPLDPLHQPHNLAPIRAIAAVRPDLPQIACFDTSFHATMPDLATRFALPPAYLAEGVRRYGFHGLSYDHIAETLRRTEPELAKGRVIAAHLGNGASMCAMLDGRSVDVSMGFSVLDGLMMGTRCGSIDPGVLLYLMRRHGMDEAAIEDLLYHRSGLLGVSGISPDMRDLHGKPAGEAAIDLFVYRAAREAAALAGSLGGLDAMVFTAGIGEHDAVVRAEICARLAWLGVAVDPERNRHHAAEIAAAGSRVRVKVIPANEEAAILRHMRALLPAR